METLKKTIISTRSVFTTKKTSFHFHKNGISDRKYYQKSKKSEILCFSSNFNFRFSQIRFPIFPLNRIFHLNESPRKPRHFQFPLRDFRFLREWKKRRCFVCSRKRSANKFDSQFVLRICDCEGVAAMADALSVIPAAVLRNLADKLYEKRKNAALEVFFSFFLSFNNYVKGDLIPQSTCNRTSIKESYK